MNKRPYVFRFGSPAPERLNFVSVDLVPSDPSSLEAPQGMGLRTNILFVNGQMPGAHGPSITSAPSGRQDSMKKESKCVPN